GFKPLVRDSLFGGWKFKDTSWSPQKNWLPLHRVSKANYKIETTTHGIKASAILLNDNKARFSIKTPDMLMAKTWTLDTSHSWSGGKTRNIEIQDAELTYDYRNYFNDIGFDFRLTCSFGLSDVSNKTYRNMHVRMDQLGPAAEWYDPAAPSLSALKAGTILEFTQDIEIGYNGSSTALPNEIIEYHGLMSDERYKTENIILPRRFSYVHFYPLQTKKFSNAIYFIKRTSLSLVNIQRIDTALNHHYVLSFKNITPANNAAEAGFSEISIRAVGRRGGFSDIKIPQFIELLKTAGINVILP
ncbi:MAG: hypothetical protein AABY53_00975, partial [Bdellovibrionota bacterium]